MGKGGIFILLLLLLLLYILQINLRMQNSFISTYT